MNSNWTSISRIWIASFACLCSLLVSCHRDPAGRFHVTGTVTFDGETVEGGFVLFEPDLANGKDGPQGIATITQGKYSTAESNKGVTEGPHIVRIRGFRTSESGDIVPLFPEFETKVEFSRDQLDYDFAVPTDLGDPLSGQPLERT